ncbi:hypothetical protein DSO57_1026707 [Entomophthora muscae]|uniref:Uncharacterized protein n=1 Tax=Entomophthora muscae TaxID=34485 RepID=A0ACC2U0G2_9FUNG|nr:hypothetical protein DSO57_1026707 [Entomophthora muscae]
MKAYRAIILLLVVIVAWVQTQRVNDSADLLVESNKVKEPTQKSKPDADTSLKNEVDPKEKTSRSSSPDSSSSSDKPQDETKKNDKNEKLDNKNESQKTLKSRKKPG